MRVAILGIGSNLGDRLGFLQSAVDHLARMRELEVEAVSPVYETDALGSPQPRFLNAAVRIRTDLELEALLDRLLAIEAAHGRERREKWGPRTLDLDILAVCDPSSGRLVEVRTPRLEVPHPALLARSFALGPLLDVAPELGLRWNSALEALGGRPARAQGSQSIVVPEHHR